MARNILQMALPMTVAQLINILYNIVDRMYLGRLRASKNEIYNNGTVLITCS